MGFSLAWNCTDEFCAKKGAKKGTKKVQTSLFLWKLCKWRFEVATEMWENQLFPFTCTLLTAVRKKVSRETDAYSRNVQMLSWLPNCAMWQPMAEQWERQSVWACAGAPHLSCVCVLNLWQNLSSSRLLTVSIRTGSLTPSCLPRRLIVDGTGPFDPRAQPSALVWRERCTLTIQYVCSKVNLVIHKLMTGWHVRLWLILFMDQSPLINEYVTEDLTTQKAPISLQRSTAGCHWCQWPLSTCKVTTGEMSLPICRQKAR